MPEASGSSIPYLLTITNIDANDNLVSGYGSDVAFAAPGQVSAATSYDAFYTTIASGAEYSAAMVAGVAALMFSVNPCLTSTQVTTILTQTAAHLGTPGWNSSFGWGQVDAGKAVAMAASTQCSTGGTTYSPCDVNQDGQTNVADVQADINAALGVIPCSATYDINKDSLCNIIDVQRVTNAALGGTCNTNP